MSTDVDVGGAAERTLIYDIVGCGAVVEIYHGPVINLLREQHRVAIHGCYDTHEASARRLALTVGASCHGTVAMPRNDDGVDGVLITAPPAFHAEIARRYIAAGKSVFVEKPFTGSAADARQLVLQSEENGTALLVNHTLRYVPAVVIARAWLQGRLEEVHNVVATTGNRFDWPMASDYIVSDPYGGVIHDVGAHLVDTTLFLLGLDDCAAGVQASIERLHKVPAREPSHECDANIALHYDSGKHIPIELRLSRLQPLAQAIKVNGAFGTLFIPTSFSSAPIMFRESTAFKVHIVSSDPQPVDLHGCFLLAHREFAGAVREPQRLTRIDARRCLLQMDVLSRLHESSAT